MEKSTKKLKDDNNVEQVKQKTVENKVNAFNPTPFVKNIEKLSAEIKMANAQIETIEAQIELINSKINQNKVILSVNGYEYESAKNNNV